MTGNSVGTWHLTLGGITIRRLKRMSYIWNFVDLARSQVTRDIGQITSN